MQFSKNITFIISKVNENRLVDNSRFKLQTGPERKDQWVISMWDDFILVLQSFEPIKFSMKV
jgi:hypothetical protein